MADRIAAVVSGVGAPTPEGVDVFGLRLSVYRSGGATRPVDLGDPRTMSARTDQLVLVGVVDYLDTMVIGGDHVPSVRPFTRADKMSMCRLEAGTSTVWLIKNKALPGNLHLAPGLASTLAPDPRWWMAGSAYAGTSDGRWSSLVGGRGPLPLHDYYEGAPR
jgi:hypothetical protein